MIFKKTQFRANEMAQWVKMLALPRPMTRMAGIHMTEAENLLLRVDL